jgi:cobalt-zinc-cadmium efflux system protein
LKKKVNGSDTVARLGLTFSITLLILVAELAGGIISNSLALLSDAGHVFTDAFALGLSLLAARISGWPADPKATYGYHRVGLLAAIINGLSLLFIAVFIFYESYRRFVSPPEIDLSVMLPVAAAGLAANLLMVMILGHDHEDLNIKSAWLHVLGDTLASFGVIISGVVIYFTGWIYADPLAGLLIGVIIIIGGVRVVRDALCVFLDLVPKGFSIEAIAEDIAHIKGVRGIHGIHLWSLSHKNVAFSAHIWVDDQKLSEVETIKNKTEAILKELGVGHIVLQFESGECEGEGIYCRVCKETPTP